jgi:hypothetical protein
LRQSKNQMVAGENVRHIVLIYSSLLSVRNCDAERFCDLAVQRHCASENRLNLPEFPLA